MHQYSDSTDEKESEKDAFDNFSLRGFDQIDDIKEILEAASPLTVSCADIITLATRDAVALAGGPKYEVPTGRRDGLTSVLKEVQLPQPDFPVNLAVKSFAEKNLTATVTLLGAHTVGVAHRSFISKTISRNQTERGFTMDPELKEKLRNICFTPSRTEATAFLDQNTTFVADNEFYNQILQKRGVLLLDQQIGFDNSTRDIVSTFASDNERFEQSFAEAMIKMGSIQVLVGNEGKIRRNCRAFNQPS